jgi:hypothetical protein
MISKILYDIHNDGALKIDKILLLKTFIRLIHLAHHEHRIALFARAPHRAVKYTE